MSGGNFRLRRPDQINSVSESAKFWIILIYNVSRYSAQLWSGGDSDPMVGRVYNDDGFAKNAGGCCRKQRSPRIAARLVRPASPKTAVAGVGRRARRSLSGLAVGNHAAADDRQGRRALFREVPFALARCGRAGARF